MGERDASPEMMAAAEQVGQEIARREGIVVCGGMEGVMEAAARGAALEGGTVVGILPTPFAEDANPYVTIPIATGMGEGRNVLVARTADAVIAVGGSYGTLSEIAFALKLDVPVVGFQTWTLQRAGMRSDPIHRADTPQEAVGMAWAMAEDRRQAAGRPASCRQHQQWRREG